MKAKVTQVVSFGRISIFFCREKAKDSYFFIMCYFHLLVKHLFLNALDKIKGLFLI